MVDLVQITSPAGVKFTVSKDAAPAFSGFLTELEGSGYKLSQPESGGYNPRNIAGTDTPSQHAFGNAIDVNWQHNPRGANTPSDLPPNVGDIAAAHGLTWGGNWKGDTRDPMHFELSGKPMAVPSDDALLSRMGTIAPAQTSQPQPATQAAAPASTEQDKPPSDDELLRRMGSVAPPAEQKAAQPPPNAPPDKGVMAVDDFGGMIDPSGNPIPPINLLSHVPLSVAEARNALAPTPGYVRAGPLPFALKETYPGSGVADPNSGWAGFKWDPGSTVAALGGNALLDLLEGTGQATSMGGDASPLAGKVSPEATAFLLGTRMGMRPKNALEFGPPETRPPGIGDRGGAALSPEFMANPLTPEAVTAAREATATPPAVPSTPTGMPATPPPEPQPTPGIGPRSAGAAATPTLDAGLTPQEIALYQKTAEGQKLMEGQEVGVPDRNAYVRGVTPNAAEQEQTAAMARELKALGIADPRVSDEMKLAAQDNAQRRVEHLQDAVKAPADLDLRERARQADIEAAKPVVFAPENVTGPVDHAPIVSRIREILDTPENRQNSAVQSVLRPLLDKLQDDIGVGKISDPREMWGLRQEIDRMTSKRSQAEDKNLHYAAHQLGEVSDVIDQQIEKVAPGYDKMIADYAEHSRAIDEMRVLQEAEPSLRSGPGQTITFNAMQRFMQRVVKARNTPTTDVNPYKSITPETMDKLWALRDDLRRSSSAMELAKASGSDTAQNAMDIAKQYGKMLGTGGIMALAHAIAPVGGPMIIRGAQNIAAPIRAARLQRQQMQRAQELLRPSNPLIDPNAPP